MVSHVLRGLLVQGKDTQVAKLKNIDILSYPNKIKNLSLVKKKKKKQGVKIILTLKCNVDFI